MRLFQTTTLALALALSAAACASSGPKAPCAIAKVDSIYVGNAPVYENCAVDRPAKLVVTRDEALQYRPARPLTGPSGCIFADAQFIVDTLGKPEPGTVRLVKTNDQDYADFVLAVVPRLSYEPAMLAGRPVRQIHTEHQTVSFFKIITTSPARSSSPPRPSGPIPKC